MYLKSLEVHGFKSFANKIKFDFHNGITGIVGPNGSGKSNVADAVRWVLGEQSAKQLRGASMQDVIFSGTENRKPVSYAYVAITLDNSDHQLLIDYEEVTIARRVYRSGESEYLINGTPCRLKEVSELFYDTGIGKEGYSIIGQGQIDKILSGKPEERRELFDEAAGIVKFKKRKITAQKKLESERENIVRVNDILSELERQVGPLERQSEKAKIYLKKKSELKDYDVNMYLLEKEDMELKKSEIHKNYDIADKQLAETNDTYENIKNEYEQLEQNISEMDEKINSIRENISNSSITRQKLEGQIQILQEQIRNAKMQDEHLSERIAMIDQDKTHREEERTSYVEKKLVLDAQFEEANQRKSEVQKRLETIQKEITSYNEEIENGQAEMIELLNNKVNIQSRQQHCETLLEQIQIRKASLNNRLLSRKTSEEDLSKAYDETKQNLDSINDSIFKLKEDENALLKKLEEWKRKELDNTRLIEECQENYHKQQSRLESLRNIAERYDGYGNSIRRVMEQKIKVPGVLGVVSDLIQVDKKYEVAIETALGGNVQNIVTEDETTAKQMITFLKENRYGRATFLPLTSVKAKTNEKIQQAAKENGVVGLANELVHCEAKYDTVVAYLLGRVLILENINSALALAKKYHHSLHIVTLDGEYLSPGGSIAGGAYKNTSNLLGRNREIEDLEKSIENLKKDIADKKARKEDILTASVLNEEELEEIKTRLQDLLIEQNTAKINLERARQQREESENVFEGLMNENREMEQQIAQIEQEKKEIALLSENSEKRKQEIELANQEKQAILEEKAMLEFEVSEEVSEISLEVANIAQTVEFTAENIERLDKEIERLEADKTKVIQDAETAKEEAAQKENDIEEIRQTIVAAGEATTSLDLELENSIRLKEEMSAQYRGFFKKQEEVSKQKSNLEKEIFRLNSQLEKLSETEEYQTNYMWEEYELTPHAALELRNEAYHNITELKKMIFDVKDEIRKLGDVNVNAIEEYKEVSERYEFLKSQHDDLIEAEQTLIGIIEELDAGMRKQFSEKFADIQKEFDKSFKQLFGGGHGTLDLVEEDDILESGIKIIAQPPGKKLQNMMQLSGGEKALTAIALLFAIQALKPSPFCLLDEIEAALDDSNVTRFAKYLNKLTQNTQFIVITHRRGTMAAADRLYGITMQEKGVSTLVSVNLIENDLTE